MDFSLIETLRWEPENGFLRLDQHLRRLNRSADALGFRLPVKPEAALKEAVSGDVALRVRLIMNFRGKIEVTVTPFEPVAESTVWRLKIAEKTRLKSDDPLYRHKTSRRDPYEAARAEYSKDEADEVLLTNERGELCEGTITNLFVEGPDGILITPPLASGLLPGILRADLIRERKARSEVVKPDMLKGKRIFVGNALRGLIRCELAETAVSKAVA
ncbi:aminotransferase class IV family protein [Allorhizobium sp. BGMRC 0089]|uniref:aminotransferase class IV family protein n=1 Tax=Allorhizobium sonneratiae TaxID=2934936 RepID=UPI002033A8DC|nr:aminotransferase class IV family protein [Allorhizobium sonneratiae]MCM2290870.1 aminotransferase class IV family protein [Allorhizobium sonneratiae]